MKNVELYAKVRHAVRIEGLSERAAARRFGIDARTVNKMMKFSVPPGYMRKKPPVKPKLDPFIAIIDGILADARQAVAGHNGDPERQASFPPSETSLGGRGQHAQSSALASLTRR
jgi:hypothetical protein